MIIKMRTFVQEIHINPFNTTMTVSLAEERKAQLNNHWIQQLALTFIKKSILIIFPVSSRPYSRIQSWILSHGDALPNLRAWPKNGTLPGGTGTSRRTKSARFFRSCKSNEWHTPQWWGSDSASEAAYTTVSTSCILPIQPWTKARLK